MSNLPVDKRTRLFRPLTIVGVLAVMGGGLWALFQFGPHAQPSVENPSELAMSYLRREIAANPGNARDRLKLARMEYTVGQPEAAEATLAPLLTVGSREGRAARKLHLDIALRRLGDEPASSAKREQRLIGARQALRELIEQDQASFTVADFEANAHQMLALEQPREAAGLYERLAERDSTQRARWLTEAARWYEASGDLERAARLLTEASGVTTDRQKAGQLAVSAVVKHQARGPVGHKDAQESARAARQRFPDSTPVRVATQPLIDELAQEETKPKGDDARVQALLGKHQIKPALALLKKMVAETPEDLSRRRWLALVARWNEQPALSLEQWFYLAGKGQSEGRKEGLELARALGDHEKVASLLELKAEAEGLSDDELYELVGAYETLGAPDKALSALDRFGVGLRSDRRYWRQRIALQEARGDANQALAELEAMKQATALGIDDVLKGIELLWKNDRTDEALAFARTNRVVATAGDADFWRQYGDLAYELGAWADARDAYRNLVQGDGTKVTPTIFDRLLQILDSENQLEEQVGLARLGYQRHGRTDWLLWAMEEAMEAKRWDLLRPLLAIAEKDEARFADQKGYWKLRAAWADQQGQKAEAEGFLRRALGTDSSKHDVYLELLKSAVAAKDVALTRRRLDAWHAELEKRPSSYEVLAEAYEIVGNHTRAARYRRAQRNEELDVDPGSLKEPANRRRRRDGSLLPASARLEMALEENDRAAAMAILEEKDAAIPVEERIEAEHALGRNERAWHALRGLEAEAARGGEGSPAATLLQGELADTRHALMAERAGRAEALFGAFQLGELRALEGTARVDIPWQALAGSVGPVVHWSYLDPRAELATFADPAHEVLAGAVLSRDVAWGATELRFGLVHTPDKTTHSAHGRQSLRWSNKGGVEVGGWYHEPTLHSAELRAVGFESGVSLGAHQTFGESNDLQVEAQGLHFGTHADELVAWGLLGRLSDTHEWQLGPVRLAVRAEGEFLLTRRSDAIPGSLSPVVDDFDTLLTSRYASAGMGVGLSSAGPDVASGVGRPWTVHYTVEAEGGWLWPSSKPWLGGVAGTGIVLPRRQEIFLRGHYYSSYRGLYEQHYVGLSLGYVLRWM